MTRRQFVVVADWPAEATDKEIEEFIVDAISTWGGSLRPPEGYGPEDPGDVMFGTRQNVVARRKK